METKYSHDGRCDGKSTRTFSAPSPQRVVIPRESTKLTFTLKQRLCGPMKSHIGAKLGFVARWFYGWLWTDDPYFARVDFELRKKGL